MIGRAFVVVLVAGAVAALSPISVAIAGGVPPHDTFTVPEPGSLVLLASGVGVLGWALWRRW